MSVKVLAKDRIVQAYNLINHLEPLSVCNVYGVQKLKRKIESEIKFLNKSLRSNDIREEHIHCSNISQLASLVEVATTIPGVTAVLKTFDLGTGEKLIIDVVGDNNCKWYKVILRNPKALHQLHIFGGRNGVRPLDKVAEDIQSAAKANPVFFVPPKVCFYFVNGVSKQLASSLKLLDVEVYGQIKSAADLGLESYNDNELSDDSDSAEVDKDTKKSNSELLSRSSSEKLESNSQSLSRSSSEKLESNSQSLSSLRSSSEKLENESSTTQDKPSQNLSSGIFSQKSSGNLSSSFTKVNLDVTCLIAFVSSTSNGGYNYTFDDQFLNEQAQSERERPVKEILKAYFKDKELIVCEEAARHFQSILETIGGEGEKERGQALLKECRVVTSQDIFKGILKKGGRIKDLSCHIFGTGQALKAPTITSNRGFVRAAENQGLKLAVLYHEPRALTEQKEMSAQIYQPNEVVQ